ncbi:MAG: sigma-70 family RNA polymerase sigma factor [Planctomycetaceae bacterium]|nr:sigma-70 family RNA polymerase sigma factor [Planctomycetaceae bacterium]
MNEVSRDLTSLLQAAMKGDNQAAAELMDAFGPMVIAVVRRRLAPELRIHFDSIDFAQAVWASMFLASPNPSEEISPESFSKRLASIARNKVTDEFRKRFQTAKHNIRREAGRVGNREEEFDTPGREASASQVAIAREYWDRLMERASSTEREIIRLRLEGYKQLEIAEELGISERTVRRALTDCFKDTAGE